MQHITLHSCADADGNLQLNIPTTLPNTELEVLVFLRPVKPSTPEQPKTFSQRWQGKFKGISQSKNNVEPDLRFEYLVERYQL